MSEFLHRLLDICRCLCYSPGRPAGHTRLVADLLSWVLSVVARWRLWRAKRKRPVVTRQWVGPVRLDLSYSKRHGYRLVAWAVMVDGPGFRHAGPERRCDVPKKPSAPGPGGDAPRQAAPRPKILDRTPVLASYLLDLQYEEGGGSREPSRLFIQAAAGEWLVTLKDPTEARQLRVRITDLGTCWAALEALLTADSCPWEPDAWAQGRKPPSRKRGS